METTATAGKFSPRRVEAQAWEGSVRLVIARCSEAPTAKPSIDSERLLCTPARAALQHNGALRSHRGRPGPGPTQQARQSDIARGAPAGPLGGAALRAAPLHRLRRLLALRAADGPLGSLPAWCRVRLRQLRGASARRCLPGPPGAEALPQRLRRLGEAHAGVGPAGLQRLHCVGR